MNPLEFPDSFKMYYVTFKTTEKDNLILLSFPQILSHLALTSTMVINLGECKVDGASWLQQVESEIREEGDGERQPEQT